MISLENSISNQNTFFPLNRLALMFKPYSDDIDEDNQKSSDYRSQNSSANKLSTNNQYLYAKLDCLSAALIDSNRTSIGELISFTSRCADFRLSVTKAKTRVSFAVGHVQVDQQRMTQDSRAPVILAPSPCKHPQPVIQLLIWKDNIQSKPDLDSFEYVAIEVREILYYLTRIGYISYAILINHNALTGSKP